MDPARRLPDASSGKAGYAKFCDTVFLFLQLRLDNQEESFKFSFIAISKEPTVVVSAIMNKLISQQCLAKINKISLQVCDGSTQIFMAIMDPLNSCIPVSVVCHTIKRMTMSNVSSGTVHRTIPRQ